MLYIYLHACTCRCTSYVQWYKHTYMQCNFLWNQRRGISKSVCLLSVTQQCSMELRLSRLPSLDEDVFSCESVPEWSFSFSTKCRPPPPIPTKGSVNVWTVLALLSRICQGIGGKGLQASGTKVFSILKPLEVAEAWFTRKGERNKRRICSQTKAMQNITSCCLQKWVSSSSTPCLSVQDPGISWPPSLLSSGAEERQMLFSASRPQGKWLSILNSHLLFSWAQWRGQWRRWQQQ